MASIAVGLDLGKAQDFSALAVVERVEVLPVGWSPLAYSRALESLDRYRQAQDRHGWERTRQRLPELVAEWHVRHLQRWQIGTPYHSVVEDVGALMGSDALADAVLYVDGTGVGSGVMEMFAQAYQRGRLGRQWPVGVTITGGQAASGWNVPKRDLISAVQVPLQQGRLRIAAGLALGEVLERELTSFRMKLSASGHDTYDVQRREGEGHGDLTLALALATYCNTSGGFPEVVEASVTA
ncbi:hypothetical protein DQ244_01605 [Blastococcus sp. TBT05-19]|uniref:hypothetical protein n=1 Tax=Blastococcus sp. TBT05-19 TaxID=2250581 RepID=UPI000DE9C380|nr:hypothetical protein [Blastococcus sp. TBT05-19]RBY94084.1 hypothetical protein DQ244_01605 [Blastococcus sp. TBT05-19]